MPSAHPLRVCILISGVLLAADPVRAQRMMSGAAPAAEHATAPTLAERAARRFPQLVRVGDLIRRQVLRPVEQQDVLGRVAAVVRRADGGVLIVINLGGTLSLGSRQVAVPVEAVALLGEHVALMDLSPTQLRALPAFTPDNTTPVPLSDTLRVGLTRPFH